MGYKYLDEYLELRLTGVSQREARSSLGIAHSTAERYEALIKDGKRRFEEDSETLANRALEDFEYFRRRYFGRVSTPWQVEAGYKVRELLATPHKEFVVINVAPGSGKSTLFVHDIPAWLASQNRAIRCMIGSRTERQAVWYVNRLRRTFERAMPVKAAKDAGVDAEATLTQDYGSFRPFNKDLWRSNEFVIAQENDVLLEDKEPTFSAYGMDSGFLGGRFDLVLWDDLVDKHTTRTAESREKLIHWYETEAETRVEPGGLLVLQGQRLGPEDLYRYALDLRHVDGTPRYTHIVYKAHYEDRCEDNADSVGSGFAGHELDALPYPANCLLDPVRLPWRELSDIRHNKLNRFRVLYQQEDVDPASVLVDPAWIEGDDTHPGCWDPNRGIAQIPRLDDMVSVVAVDPSPTKQWACVWFAYHQPSNQTFLLDLYNGPMTAGEFLDWNYQQHQFTGLMNEWQTRSNDLAFPITHWIVEANAAQRFLLAYEHSHRFQMAHSTTLLPHQTNRNKNDENYGVWTLGPEFQFGRMRIPGALDGKKTFEPMVRELTRYPESATDDIVMALWMGKLNLPHISIRNKGGYKRWTPSWLKGGERGLVNVP